MPKIPQSNGSYFLGFHNPAPRSPQTHFSAAARISFSCHGVPPFCSHPTKVSARNNHNNGYFGGFHLQPFRLRHRGHLQESSSKSTRILAAMPFSIDSSWSFTDVFIHSQYISTSIRFSPMYVSFRGYTQGLSSVPDPYFLPPLARCFSATLFDASPIGVLAHAIHLLSKRQVGIISSDLLE